MTDIVPYKNSTAIEKVRDSGGSVADLTAIERKLYYLEMCSVYGFEPLSLPFDYIESDGKLKLYINSVGASQLRSRFNISISIKSREFSEDMWIVVAIAQRGDRTEEATGVAPAVDKYGKSTAIVKANALKKAETQARRRATLAICGYGGDEEDTGNIIQAATYDPPQDVLPLPEIWRDWKTPKDAIAWAKSLLPHMSEQELQREFDSLPDGKKAAAWVRKVQLLKTF